ncbi:solute carrier family 46 member 2-like [Panulirus ornatus]|uniref:solute carrier family 46 member 2-like n=1 Tax=Panulirus ornatus TaxID=150431 RepID=UPI003A8ACE86
MAEGVVAGLMGVLRTITVEPVMLVDGACKEAMLLFIENVQMNKICSVNLGLSPEVCANLSAHPEENVRVQREFSVFTFYNSIILSVLPLIFVLFMGAWSDKYGRKIPMLVTLVGHVMYAGGYLLSNWQTTWPVEVLYLVTLLEALGGTNAGILSSTISYISDICRENQRTSRVSTANSMWFLGGPLGTLIGALIIKYSDYNVALGLVLLSYIGAVVYVVFFIKESHGPFAKKKLRAQGSLKDEPTFEKKDVSVSTMVADFFNWRRVVESFKTAFKKREGNTRTILMAVVFGNMIRRVARGFFMYMFVRRALHWEATDYGYWITYRNLLAALGSLFLVPLLTRMLSFTDPSLVVLGAVSIIGEYVCYGLVMGPPQSFLMWLGPPAGVISNAMVISFKSMSTKLVASKEKGRINAVMAALNGLMPMVGYAAYSPIYYKTVDTFPAAQFFFGAGLNVLIMITFIVVELLRASSSYNAEDLEAAKKDNQGILSILKRRSSVTLKSVARTLSGPGGRHVTVMPQPSWSQQLPTITEIADEKVRVLDLPPAAASKSSLGQHTAAAWDMALTAAERSLRSKCTNNINSSLATDNNNWPTMRTKEPKITRDLPQEACNLQVAAGCYVNTLSEAEMTASERTSATIPLDNEAVRDPGNTPHNSVLTYQSS